MRASGLVLLASVCKEWWFGGIYERNPGNIEESLTYDRFSDFATVPAQ